jgi:hypothetical protein
MVLAGAAIIILCSFFLTNWLLSDQPVAINSKPGAAVPQETLVHITNYAPKEVKRGQPFGVQPDGSSAMWFVISGNVPLDSKILFGDQILTPAIGKDVVTVIVPLELIQNTKRAMISITSPDGRPRSDQVALQVIDP